MVIDSETLAWNVLHMHVFLAKMLGSPWGLSAGDGGPRLQSGESWHALRELHCLAQPPPVVADCSFWWGVEKSHFAAHKAQCGVITFLDPADLHKPTPHLDALLHLLHHIFHRLQVHHEAVFLPHRHAIVVPDAIVELNEPTLGQTPKSVPSTTTAKILRKGASCKTFGFLECTMLCSLLTRRRKLSDVRANKIIHGLEV